VAGVFQGPRAEPIHSSLVRRRKFALSENIQADEQRAREDGPPPKKRVHRGVMASARYGAGHNGHMKHRASRTAAPGAAQPARLVHDPAPVVTVETVEEENA